MFSAINISSCFWFPKCLQIFLFPQSRTAQEITEKGIRIIPLKEVTYKTQEKQLYCGHNMYLHAAGVLRDLKWDISNVIERETYTLFPVTALVALIALQKWQGAQEHQHAASSHSLCQIKCVHLLKDRILTACCVHEIYDKDSEYLLRLECFRKREWLEFPTKCKIHKEATILKYLKYFHFSFVCALFCGFLYKIGN